MSHLRLLEGPARPLLLLAAVFTLTCGEGRALAAEGQRIAEVLEVRAGSRVADLGAGDGRWSEELARRVGETGHVWATEVERGLVEKIAERMAEAGLGNVTAVLGSQEDLGLEADCCDAILLRLVYHHFEDPAKMRAGLRRALRAGGRLAIVDIRPQSDWRELAGVPDRGGHGIGPAELIDEMAADGFELVAEYEEWPGDEDRYCLVFRVAASVSVE